MTTSSIVTNNITAPFLLPDLPYESHDLEPYITSNTLDFHHKKHHQTYITNLNNLISEKENEIKYGNKKLDNIIIDSYNKDALIFNNAAQVWNHTFYWHSMKPNGGGEPSNNKSSDAKYAKVLCEKIDKAFGSFSKFKEAFTKAGIGQFGSGWVWLALNDDGELNIMKTSNAELPMIKGAKALITSDVWEHAYYLDYQNKRVEYLQVFLDKLINWDFAIENFKLSLLEK